jgi:hypothetical protein
VSGTSDNQASGQSNFVQLHGIILRGLKKQRNQFFANFQHPRGFSRKVLKIVLSSAFFDEKTVIFFLFRRFKTTHPL